MVERQKKRVTNEYNVNMPVSRWRDIGGRKFAMLTGIAPTGQKKWGQHVWRFRCDCGVEIERAAGLVTSGGTQSCGCLLKTAPSQIRHGMANTPIHNRWLTMKKRCEYSKDPSYKRYGARGIHVCERWQTFENFYADMGDIPFEFAQLDRIDTDGHYEPGNVRWLHRSENARRARHPAISKILTSDLQDRDTPNLSPTPLDPWARAITARDAFTAHLTPDELH